MTLSDSFPQALIFDMDGVLIDSNPFHLQKWVDLLTERGIPFTPEDLPGQIFGHRNNTVLRLFFGSDLDRAQRRQLSDELEARFRTVFRPHAAPLPGLSQLIAECDRAGIPMAVASSATRRNIDFVIEALGFGHYFHTTASGDEVSKAKPDPEIYLTTAHKMGIRPDACVAFEDSFPGIESVKRAGMKCVGIASSFAFEELQKTGADLVVRSFEELSLARLRRLFEA